MRIHRRSTPDVNTATADTASSDASAMPPASGPAAPATGPGTYAPTGPASPATTPARSVAAPTPAPYATPPARHWSAPRSRGALSGIGLMLLGAWGAVIPFVGPYFDYAYTPNHAWTWTAGRGYLEVLPGALAFLAGLGLLVTKHRATGSMFAWFGILAGAWFVVGPLVAPTWDRTVVGTPVGGVRTVAVEQIGIFFGLGAAIVLLASAAMGRFSIASPVVEPSVAPAAPMAPVGQQPAYGPQNQAADRLEQPNGAKHRSGFLSRHRHAGAH